MKEIYAMLDAGDGEDRHSHEYYEYKREALARHLGYPTDSINPNLVDRFTLEFGGKQYGVYFISELEQLAKPRNVELVSIGNISLFIENKSDGNKDSSG